MFNKKIAIGLIAGVMAVVPVSVAGASSVPPQYRGLVKAQATCQKAIGTNQTITSKDIKACTYAEFAVTEQCNSGKTVYEVGFGNDSALLLIGAKPKVYNEVNLYVSDFKVLCGDPVGSFLTAPGTPLTLHQVKAVYKSLPRLP